MEIYQKNYFSMVQILCAGAGIVSGILLLAIAPLQFMMIAIGIVVLSLIAFKTEIGILLIVILLSSIVFEKSLPLIPIGIGSFHISDVILLFMLGIVGFKTINIGAHGYVRTPFDLPLALFLMTALASTCIAIMHHGTDINQILRTLRVITYYLIVILITNLIRDEKQIRILLRGVFVIAGAVAATMLVQAIIGDSVQLMPGRIEAAATFDKHYEALRILPPGQTLIFISLITAICVVTFRQNKILLLSSYLYLIILLVISIVLTYNRNYWIGLFLAICLLTVITGIESKKRLLALLLAVAILAGSLGPLLGNLSGRVDKAFYAVSGRLISLFAGKKLIKSESLEDRYVENRYALKQIGDHPILGIGLGNAYRPEVFGLNDELTNYIHNAYLWILTDMGLLGFLLFFWFYFRFIIRARNNWRKIQDNFFKAAVVGFMVSGIVMLFMAMVIPIFMEWNSIVVIATMIGLTEAIIRNSVMGSHKRLDNPIRISSKPK
jgi:hypothetical protein